MKKEQQNIIITIGLTMKIDICKQFYIFLLLGCFFSCSKNIHTQNKYKCESILHYDSITNKNVYYFVDEMPIFSENKHDNLARYIMEKYVDDPRKVGFQFSVKLRFVIDKEGYLMGAGIFNKEENFTRKCTEEENKIIEIIKSSPKWKPGICSGQRVDVLVKMRLGFVIDENGRLR